MDNTELTNFLAWCTTINYIILVIWFIGFITAHNWLYSLHARWFELNNKQFHLFNYAGMGLYKLLIFVFNLTPYIALRIINS